MSQFDIEHLKLMKEGIELYNKEFYWECHEVLEDPWMESGSDNAKYVYWAVIQVATALFHYKNENLAGALGMIQKAQEKVLHCEKHGVESNILKRYLSWGTFKKRVLSIPKNAKLEDFALLYEFKFSNPEVWEKGLK